jgi:hypothetical protein
MSGRTILARLLLVSLAALVVACDDGGAGGEPTDEPLPGTPQEGTATIPPNGVTDIRQADLVTQPEIVDFLSTSGGAIDGTRIVYLDLTEDGEEEAVIPISSGGEGGDIAVFVYGYQDGQLAELLRATPDGSSLSVETGGGTLIIVQPVYGEGDPLCCPSQLRRTTYQWDGTALSVAGDETVPAEGSE